MICLLFALKIQYPDNVILLRGYMEDSKVNRLLGFAEECLVRLPEDPFKKDSTYFMIN